MRIKKQGREAEEKGSEKFPTLLHISIGLYGCRKKTFVSGKNNIRRERNSSVSTPLPIEADIKTTKRFSLVFRNNFTKISIQRQV